MLDFLKSKDAIQPTPVVAQNLISRIEDRLTEIEESTKARFNTVAALVVSEVRKLDPKAAAAAAAPAPAPAPAEPADPVVTANAHIDAAIVELAKQHDAAVAALQAKKEEIAKAKALLDQAVAGQ